MGCEQAVDHSLTGKDPCLSLVLVVRDVAPHVEPAPAQPALPRHNWKLRYQFNSADRWKGRERKSDRWRQRVPSQWRKEKAKCRRPNEDETDWSRLPSDRSDILQQRKADPTFGKVVGVVQSASCLFHQARAAASFAGFVPAGRSQHCSAMIRQRKARCTQHLACHPQATLSTNLAASIIRCCHGNFAAITPLSGRREETAPC